MKGFLFALLAAALLAAPAHGAKPSGTLHPGATGKHVAALQWLLHGGKPYVFHEVKPTFKWGPNGFLGQRTEDAITTMKWRLGYPRSLVKPVAGPYFFALLKGKLKRPASWVARAAARVKAVIAAQPTRLALRIRAYELSQIGVMEQPPGCNCGAQVRVYQSDTGAYGAAWCVSFQQHSFRVGGYGHFASDTASVYYAADYYAARNMLHAKPKVGALVLFIDYDRSGHRIPGTGHMGFVVRLTADGYVSVEGNEANGVHERFHGLHDRGNVFAYLPGVA